MVINRIVATVLAVVVLSACGGPDERDLHQALKSAGCAVPESQYQRLPGRVVLSISVMGCRLPDDHGGSRLLTSTEATTLVATTAWSAPAFRYDTLFVTNYNVATSNGSGVSKWSEEISREALAARHALPELDMDTPPAASLDDDRAAASPWAVIPPLAAVLGLLLFMALVRAIRGGLISIICIVR